MIHWVDLGKAVQRMYSSEDFPLPSIEVTKDEIMNKGAALIKWDKIVGWVGGKDAIMSLEITNLKNKNPSYWIWLRTTGMILFLMSKPR